MNSLPRPGPSLRASTVPAVHLGQPLHEREADAEAALRAPAVWLDLHEEVEHAGELRRIDADPGVAHADRHAVVDVLDGEA